MYATYIVIAVMLVLIGVVSSVYFVRFLKITNVQGIAVSALSESLSTFFIGVFYFYCAIVMSQHIFTSPSIPSFDNDNDITIIEENQGNMTEEDLPVAPTTDTYPNEGFLLSYQAFLNSAIKQSSSKKEKEYEQSTSGNQENNSTVFVDPEQCFEEIFMEYSMFLYSFLHSVVSLMLHATKEPELRSRSIKNPSETEPNSQTEETLRGNRFKLIAKILVTFLIPIISIIALYFVMDENVEKNVITKLYGSDSTSVWNIIHQPINVSIPGKTQEINDIVQNIYTIVNASRDATAPTKYDLYNLSTRRRPKQVETCPELKMVTRFYTILVFLFYLVTILYTKIKETKMSVNDEKATKQLRLSIILFAVLWSCSVLEMFTKTYFLDGSRYNFLSEIFLSLANLNQLSIIIMNYLTAKETMKKYNLVEPKA